MHSILSKSPHNLCMGLFLKLNQNYLSLQSWHSPKIYRVHHIYWPPCSIFKVFNTFYWVLPPKNHIYKFLQVKETSGGQLKFYFCSLLKVENSQFSLLISIWGEYINFVTLISIFFGPSPCHPIPFKLWKPAQISVPLITILLAPSPPPSRWQNLCLALTKSIQIQN